MCEDTPGPQTRPSTSDPGDLQRVGPPACSREERVGELIGNRVKKRWSLKPRLKEAFHSGGGGEEMGIDRRERVPPVQRRGERGSGMSYGVITGGPGLHTR